MLRTQIAGAGVVCALCLGVAGETIRAHSKESGRTAIAELPTAGHQDPHEEIRRLFKKVELRLRQIDRLLADAAAGGTAKPIEAGKAGIDTLLKDSGERAHQTVKDIDRILELANHPHEPGGT